MSRKKNCVTISRMDAFLAPHSCFRTVSIFNKNSYAIPAFMRKQHYKVPRPMKSIYTSLTPPEIINAAALMAL